MMQHRLSDLRYRLLEGPIPLAPLCILAERTITWQDWNVTFTILGASHAVRLERAGTCMIELLTCAPPAAAGSVLLEATADRQRVLHAQFCHWRFEVCLLPFSLAEGDALSPDCPPAQQLAYAYRPHPHGAVPLTRIGWRLDPESLRIETVHTYPEEGRGLRSDTQFFKSRD